MLRRRERVELVLTMAILERSVLEIATADREDLFSAENQVTDFPVGQHRQGPHWKLAVAQLKRDETWDQTFQK